MYRHTSICNAYKYLSFNSAELEVQAVIGDKVKMHHENKI